MASRSSLADPTICVQLRTVSSLSGLRDSYNPVILVGPKSFFKLFPWCLTNWCGSEISINEYTGGLGGKRLLEAATADPRVLIFGSEHLVTRGVATGVCYEVPDSSGQTQMALPQCLID